MVQKYVIFPIEAIPCGISNIPCEIQNIKISGYTSINRNMLGDKKMTLHKHYTILPTPEPRNHICFLTTKQSTF